MSLSSESSFSAPTEELSSASNVASKGSTPPTSVPDSDNASQSSDLPKLDALSVQVAAATPTALQPASVDPAPSTPGPADVDANAPPTTATSTTPSSSRPKRARANAPVYNLSKLSGTDVHGKRRAKGDFILTDKKRRRTATGATPNRVVTSTTQSPDTARKDSRNLVRDGIDALHLQWSVPALDTPRTRRQAKSASPAKAARDTSRFSTGKSSSFSKKISKLGKQTRAATDATTTRMKRELRRLQDTNEFSHIDIQPIYHTVWSNGKEVRLDANGQPISKRQKAPLKKKVAPEPAEESPAPLPPPPRKKAKKYLEKGLYSGQPLADYKEGLNTAEKRRLAQMPELKDPPPSNKTLPFPMFNGLRALLQGRDYKLPFSVCNPLPPGQPKPDEWRKMTKNRFIGESKDIWRKEAHLGNDFSSKCVCEPEDGCGESCQNRIMLYECDEMNCNVGRQHCTNRAFTELAERKGLGGRYRIGVEVFKTDDRGYGVRSNRCFEPNQIITEYTGEIITEEECDRRMNEKYKNNACYYLMSFDQNMIIDATTGSIARFVNHSCNPNCRMIKWIVGGNPRMALFAGDRPIQTGDELTYDYKFDPFSSKNVQSCLCGETNCRGVLGPKPKEEKKPKEDKTAAKGKGKGKKNDVKEAVKATVKKGKRKLDELTGSDEAEANTPKKRKIMAVKGLKKSISAASLKAAKGAKGAAAVVKRKVSSVTLKRVTVSMKRRGPGRSPAKKPKKTAKGKGTPLKSSKKSPASKALAKGKALSSKSPKPTKAVSRKSATGGVTKAKPAKKAFTARINDTYSLNNLEITTSSPSGRKRSTSILVVMGDENAEPLKLSPVSKSGRVRKLTEKASEMAASPKGRKALELSRSVTKIRVVESDD